MELLFKRLLGKAEIFLRIMQAVQFVQNFFCQLHFLKLKKNISKNMITKKYAGLI